MLAVDFSQTIQGSKVKGLEVLGKESRRWGSESPVSQYVPRHTFLIALCNAGPQPILEHEGSFGAAHWKIRVAMIHPKLWSDGRLFDRIWRRLRDAFALLSTKRS